MANIRVIPRLDIKGPNLVKGIHLEGLRVLGKPERFAKFYYENGADELMFMDVVASLYERNSLQEIITQTAKEIFIPLTVGGGLRSIEDINNVLRAGADKVALNTAAINDPNLIRKAAKKFGSSTIVVAIEAIKQDGGNYLAFTDNAREYTGKDVVEWAQTIEEMGAGEICLTSVDREGTGQGYDLDLIKRVSDVVSIPVIAHGGAGKAEDVSSAINKGGADAVTMASILHYDFIENHRMQDNYESEGNVTFLTSGKTSSKIAPCHLDDVKSHLIESNISCRIVK